MNELTKRYVPGYGPTKQNVELMFVGEAPSYEELEAGRPFVGPAGRELDKLCKDSGINRPNCWVTNVSKYFVPFGPRQGKKQPFRLRARNAGINLESQVSELVTEIRSIKPNCICILGGSALEALYGDGKKISEYRGSIISVLGVKAVPTWHPASLVHQSKGGEIQSYWQRQVMIFDLQRALRQSKYAEINRPPRILHICRSSAHLAEFIARGIERTKRINKNKRPRLSIDIEARECIPICIGLAFDETEGICVPLWNEKGISNIPEADLVSCWLIMSNLFMNRDIDIIGQNFKYDQDKITKLGLPIHGLYSDTMLKAFAINPELPKNLAFNTSIYTEEPFYKNEGMYEGSLEDLFIGCARDACVTWEVDHKMDKDLDELDMRSFYQNFTMKLHDLYLEIENEGFKVNYEKREQLLRKYIRWDEELSYKLWQMNNQSAMNSGSWQQVRKFLFDHLNLPERASTGEEDLTALLNNTAACRRPEQRLGIEYVLEQRRVRKTINTYLMAIPDFDGRMRTTYFLCLETGRTSTGQQDPPIRPSVEYKDFDGKKKRKPLGTAFQVITKHGDIGQDIRSMYEVDEGEVFIQGDSSQAEARVVARLANDEEALKMYDEHDIHALTASWFFGGSEDDYSKRKLGFESPFRFAGKTLRHAGNLGAKKRRAMLELNTQARKYKIKDRNGDNFQITEGFAGRALQIFHERSPRIRKVFHAGIEHALAVGELINGNRIYRILTAPLPYGVDSAQGGRRIFYERWSDELFREAFAYIPQRAVSDNTKAAAIRIKQRAPWVRIILEAHDALLCSVVLDKVHEAGRIIIEEMERPIDFSQCSLPRPNLKIPCELEIGYNYQELSKFNLSATVLPVNESISEKSRESTHEQQTAVN